MQAPERKKFMIVAPALLVGLAALALVAGGFFTGKKAGGNMPSAGAGPLFQSQEAKVPVRESATFIMGADSSPQNRYYTQARQYYQLNPEARTERLITSLRSLQEVRDYLESEPPANGLPWGRINLVVHSNEWTGMECPVLPGGKRSDTKKLRAAIDSGEFPALVDELIDSGTEIMVYGCALGRDLELMETLSIAFGGESPDAERPLVRSSRYFINYFTESVNGRPQHSRRMVTDFRYAFYRTGYRPADYQLVNQLQKRYPGDSIDFAEAMRHESPAFPGQNYHHTFKVPVVLLVTYDRAEDRPDFGTEELRMAWLDRQTELDTVFQDFQLDKSLFTWTFQKIRHELEDGRKVPAVKLIGLCDVLCVLAPLKDKNGNPLAPALDDPRFFAQTGPVLAENTFSER